MLQGVPLHLNCTPTCLAPSSSSAKVIWHFSDASSARLVKIDYEEYILSQDFGLVVLDVRSRHNGTFSCSVNGYIVARHQVKVLRKSTPPPSAPSSFYHKNESYSFEMPVFRMLSIKRLSTRFYEKCCTVVE